MMTKIFPTEKLVICKKKTSLGDSRFNYLVRGRLVKWVTNLLDPH